MLSRSMKIGIFFLHISRFAFYTYSSGDYDPNMDLYIRFDP